MKKVVLIFCAVMLLMLSACTLKLPEVSAPSGYEYSYQTTDAAVTEAETTQTAVTEPVTEVTIAPQVTQAGETTTGVTEQTTASVVPEPSSETATQPAEIPSDMELNISMPGKNGTMVTDKSSDNKFVKIICSQRKIDSSLLVAVYAVPESGQNYVFEFTDAQVRTADNLRRVYLIDANGDITGVAAVDSAEKEKLSAVENWFSMNVLIKGVIFPAIEKELK